MSYIKVKSTLVQARARQRLSEILEIREQKKKDLLNEKVNQENNDVFRRMFFLRKYTEVDALRYYEVTSSCVESIDWFFVTTHGSDDLEKISRLLISAQSSSDGFMYLSDKDVNVLGALSQEKPDEACEFLNSE